MKLVQLLFFLLATAAYGQSGEIHGTVTKGRKHQPFPGVQVILRNEKSAIDTVFTDAAGNFSFSDVPANAGLYTIEARAEGYLPHLVTHIPVTGEGNPFVEIQPIKSRRRHRAREVRIG